MTESFFKADISREFDSNSQKRINFVSCLKKGSHVHVSGACGTGTGSLLCLLKELGFYVTGSDKAFYPPMGEFIKSYADKLYEKFSADNLEPKPDLVVIGNALSISNEEVQEVLTKGIPFCSMPELLAALLIGDRSFSKTSIVVSGTHGKTTTTALISHTLQQLGVNPGYFFGGVPTGETLTLPIRAVDLSKSPEERVTVIEGDEYDSAFFAKYSKFHCYRPDIAIITNLEFDHADIFSTIEDIEKEFFALLKRVPASGAVIVCRDDLRAKALVEKFLTLQTNVPKVIWYGRDPASDICFVSKEISADLSQSKLFYTYNNENLEVETSLSGNHNALNIAAALGVVIVLNLDLASAAKSLKSFSQVKRRQQLLINNPKIVLIEDFAHHPTEVACTLEGIKEVYKNRRVVAVFEPRSNTSRKAFFKNEYVKGLSFADTIIIKEVDSSVAVYSGVSKDNTLLDVRALAAELTALSKPTNCFAGIEQIESKIKELYIPGDVFVVMSNGDFGGLINRLADWGAKL